jgi:hypothetical protein
VYRKRSSRIGAGHEEASRLVTRRWLRWNDVGRLSQRSTQPVGQDTMACGASGLCLPAGHRDEVCVAAQKPQSIRAASLTTVISPAKIAVSWSGPGETRTRDLRHAKVARQFAGDFWALQNPCKYRFLFYEDFPNPSQYLLGLLHGCCTQRRPLMPRSSQVLAKWITRGHVLPVRRSSTWQ